ncbi:MAG: tRNA uracil 4-sulfurtransferase ThiI [Candidatus Woesearchaeota archaeon]
MNKLVIHYSEIGTKGKNRDFFEKKLMENLKKVLAEDATKVYRRYGVIISDLKERVDQNKITESLRLMPGISHFSFAVEARLDLEEIKEQALAVLEEKEFTLFKVETKRSNKQFPLKSPDVSREVGKFIEAKTGKKADYKQAEVVLNVEIGEKQVFIYAGKIAGVGGLPTGTAGKVVCSLSGGIDSPVASFLLMKRGCEVVFVHFFNKTIKGDAVLEKIEDLVKQLSKIQLKAKLYIIPFAEVQKEITLNVPAKSRMIVYRRFMMKIINQILIKEKAKGIVTGDSVGQVASQTLDNLTCIYAAASFPLFAPLIGMNKEEIVNLGKMIGTYEISIQPYPDCCSFMIAQHPETKGKLEEIEKAEDFIEDKENLVREAVEKAEVKSF